MSSCWVIIFICDVAVITVEYPELVGSYIMACFPAELIAICKTKTFVIGLELSNICFLRT